MTREFAWSLYDDIVWLTKNMGTDMPEHAFMSVGAMVVSSGYAFEEHKIVTKDGYILTAFRIPGTL